eukprot:3936581-Pyramimonas_sp.AAC.1
MTWATVTGGGRAQKPPPAHPLWCRAPVTPAVPWTTAAEGGRAQRPPPAHHLWCRDYATPATSCACKRAL